MVIEKEILLQIHGGAITSSFLSSIARLISTIFNWGKSIGSTIRRLKEGTYCN